jgi:hypothetical protein
MLTIKSDDVNGRSKAYESIVKGENLRRPGIPESFKVLVRELQSIGLDLSVAKRTKDGEEVEVDLMAEVEEVPARGSRRPSPFGEIGLESELAELTNKQQMLSQTAVAVGDPEAEEGQAIEGDIRPDIDPELALGLRAVLGTELESTGMPDVDADIEVESDPIEETLALVEEEPVGLEDVSDSVEEEV